jgi:hypothetical protein
MGMIGELIEWLRETDDTAEIAEGRVDFGGGDTATCVDYQPSGHDSQPQGGDFAIVVPGPESGSYVIVGWVDPNNAGVAKEGEARLYSRSGADVVGALHVTADGEKPEDVKDVVMELIARDDRVQSQLSGIETMLTDLIKAHDTHQHNATNGASIPTVTTTKTYAVGATACDKVYVS